MTDDAPLRIRIKEWGEATNVWVKNLAIAGAAGFGIVDGDSVVRILRHVIGG